METSVNNKCKAFTSLEQSRKLAEILPLESADMRYKEYTSELDYSSKHCDVPSVGHPFSRDIPCWSLSALLSVLPKIGSEEPIIQKLYYANNPTERYICLYSLTNITGEYDNPVDACYEMILKLHELNLL